jgi:hypothetical protein
MAHDITVERKGGNRYEVTVEEPGSTSSHLVSAAADDVTRLGGGADTEDLVEASFRFLLDREPKESILSSFDLSVIPRYFPDYESRIGDYL